jgi:hypothetical protein
MKDKKKDDSKEIKEMKSLNTIGFWKKMIACTVVVGACVFFKLPFSDYSSHSSSSSYSQAGDNEKLCKRVFPEKYSTIALYKRYPDCYRKPAS